MKRLFLSLFVASVTFICAHAQTYLVNTYQPVDSFCYEAYPYKGASSPKISMSGGLEWCGGFTIKHTLSTYDPGYAIFELGGKYETLLFVMGHLTTNTGAGGSGIDTQPGIITVYADGVKVMDKKVYPYGIPERISLNISGVNRLEFRLVAGRAPTGFAEATLWKAGETPRETGNLITEKPKTIEIGKDLKPYFHNYIIKVIGDDCKPIKINGQTYDSGLSTSMPMAMVGNSWGSAYFNVRGQYSKLSFIAGPQDGEKTGRGWLTVKADERIIWEHEMDNDDVAQQVTLDIEGCQMLSFHSEQDMGNLNGGFVNIKAYPAGEAVPAAGMIEAPVDPKLKTLPNVCKLISNIPPYAIASNVDKQIYDGRSDYITFSMGGTKFSEGFILYSRSSFLSSNPLSYTVFDLGHEFDYLTFTAGYLGKSGAMTNNRLKVFADDELVFETELIATAPNKHCVVPLNKCRKLRFENEGSGSLSVGAFGVADLVLYRGEPVPNNLFEHPKPECPHDIELLDLEMPYIHYMGLGTREEVLLDGSTRKNYWDVAGTRINKGFMLQTSTHFSLDFGPLSGGSNNAAAGAAGAVAAGSAFVPAGVAVGGAVVGSTLIGAAALLALAAGGEAVENSCAAFNTYGEYNSLTFTVTCYKPFSVKDNRTETLWIGVNGEVAAEMTVYETMEPQTITIPIEGCHQLMFWLCNTGGTSGRYVFYDIKLTKDRLPLHIPKMARLSNAVVTEPVWDVPEENPVYWEHPGNSGDKYIDSYLQQISFFYKSVGKLLKGGRPGYRINTWFLETNAGQVCKAVRLMSVLSKDVAQNIILERDYASHELESLYELKNDLIDLNLMKVNASLALPNLGFGAVAYGKVIKVTTDVLKEGKVLVNQMIKDKEAELAFLNSVIGTAVNIDGKQSTDRLIFCPLFPEDEVPDGGLMLVEVFND